MKTKTEWTLREEIYAAAHRWPQFLLAFILGSLLGWGLTFLVPTSYRAERGLLVTFNPDALYRNPDDYKNWQLDTLDLLLHSEETLQTTLERLRGQDAYWDSLAVGDLQGRLHVYWRNAGEWRLVAEAPSPQLATQLAQAWREASLAISEEAFAHAHQLLSLDAQLKALAAVQTDARLRDARLSAAQNELHTWRKSLEGTSATSALPVQDRWRLLSLVSLIVQDDEAGKVLLAEAPPEETPASAYLPWLERALDYAANELALSQQHLPEISAEFESAAARWNEEYGLARGLSAYGGVEPLEEVDEPARSVRPASWAALAGGLLGLLVWGLVQAARIFTKAPA
ncbi:MAG: hypothetical protein PHD58_07555 [Anaerolineales bacterium]|nr:hypothetical protein [Anaerolineales bacterium]